MARAKRSRQKMNYAQLEKLYNDLRERKGHNSWARKAELLKEPTEARQEARRLSEEPPDRFGPDADRRSDPQDGQFRLLDPRSPDQRQFSTTSSIVAKFATSAFASLSNLKPADLAPDGPGKKPDSLARAFVSHPNKELLQIHNPERFGCSSCHWGNGRATTERSERARPSQVLAVADVREREHRGRLPAVPRERSRDAGRRHAESRSRSFLRARLRRLSSLRRV